MNALIQYFLVYLLYPDLKSRTGNMTDPFNLVVYRLQHAALASRRANVAQGMLIGAAWGHFTYNYKRWIPESLNLIQQKPCSIT